MKNMMRCSACGRRHKKGHEARVGTDKAYTKECVKYVRTTGKSWQPNDKNTMSHIVNIPKYMQPKKKKSVPATISKPRPAVPKHHQQEKSINKTPFSKLMKMFRGGDK